MRALAILLLLANLGFFALAEGWLAPLLVLSTQQQREPQRLAAQVAPQAIRIVGPGGASTAPPQTPAVPAQALPEPTQAPLAASPASR